MDSPPFIDPQQRREFGEALLHVSDLIAASRTMCLHCKQSSATKVEGPDGFTLCDACYFATGLDDTGLMPLPPQSAQSRFIARLMAENERLRRALYACERILAGGEE